MLFSPAPVKHRRIDQMELGDRTTGRNPLREEVSETPEPTPENSRAVHLELTKPSGKVVRMRLIWTLDEIELLGAKPGTNAYLEMPEMGVEGDALVTNVTTWHAKPGSGNLVTGVFVHEPDNGLVNVHIEGLNEPIGCTAEHLFWSNDQRKFISAIQLQPNEHVLARDIGSMPVKKIEARSRFEPVFNLTTHNQHVYEVSPIGVLVHNTYAPNSAASRGFKAATEHVENAASSIVARRRAAELAGLGDESVQLISDVGPQKGWIIGRQSKNP